VLAELNINFPFSLKTITLTDQKALAACLSIGFLVRVIPELLAFPLPIGFDTISYAVVMESGVVWAHWSTFFTSSWLLYALIVPLYGLFQGDPFLLLKVVAPLLFGLNVAGIYWFSRKMLGWNMRMGLFAGVFFALQLASLRISWDLLRNTLGLGILLIALAYVKDVGSRRGFAVFAVFSLLSVFAHEFAAVTLLVVVLGLLVWRLVKRQVDSGFKRLAFASLPALAVFMVGMSLRFFPVSYVTETNVISAGDGVSGSVGGLFFMLDYLQIRAPVDNYGSYANLALSVGLLFTVLFLPYLLLVVKGFFRNGVLDLWTALLIVGAFGCLVVPFFALGFWRRWMFMLAYPFTFYAVNGFGKLASKFREGKLRLSSWVFSAAMILLTFGLGFAYLATPVMMAYANTSLPSLSGTYRYFSTSPTVPYEDVESVVQALNWLNANLSVASIVILHHAFLNWGKLVLDNSHKIVYFENNFVSAVNTAFSNGFSSVFFVWWNEHNGWYGLNIPEGCVAQKDFGRISVYEFVG